MGFLAYPLIVVASVYIGAFAFSTSDGNCGDGLTPVNTISRIQYVVERLGQTFFWLTVFCAVFVVKEIYKIIR